MDPVTLILAAGTAAAGIYAAYRRHQQQAQELPPAMFGGPLVKIGSASEGQMQLVTGHVVAPAKGDPLIAPLSGRPCVYYELTVLEHEPGDRNDPGGWSTRLFDWAGGSFLIADDTGRALIQHERPQVFLDIDCVAKPKLFRKLPQELQATLERLAQRGKFLPPLGSGAVAIREGVLEIGERVFVWGFASWQVDPNAGDYRQTARRLLLAPSYNGQMAITDIAPKGS